MPTKDKQIIGSLLQLIARGRFDVTGEGALQVANIVRTAQEYLAESALANKAAEAAAEVKEDAE